jgi:hypothetical protein
MLPVERVAVEILDLLLKSNGFPQPRSGARSEAASGIYRSGRTGRVLEIEDPEGEPFVRYCNSALIPLDGGNGLPTAVGRFWIEQDMTVRGPLLVHDGGRELSFDCLLEPGVQIPPEAHGRFASNELDASLEIQGDDQIITHGLFGSGTLGPVRPIARDIYGTDELCGLPFPTIIEIERGGSGEVTGLAVTTARSSRLRFERQAA